MGQTADQLRQEIAGKRDDAAAKIDQIEARVQALPDLAKETARETVDQSIHQARAAVEEKVGQMKQQADVRGQIEQRPLAALGIAFAGGYLLSKMLGGEKSGRSDYQTDWSQSHASDHDRASSGYESGGMGIAASGAGTYSYGKSRGSDQPNAIVASLKQAARDAGLDNTLSALTGALVSTLTDQFNRTVEETFPEFAQHLKQQGGLGGSQRSGSTGGSSSGGSMGSGGLSMAGSGSSMGESGMSGSASGGSQTYGQQPSNADAASRTYGTGAAGAAATDASGRPTSYFGDGQATAQ